MNGARIRSHAVTEYQTIKFEQAGAIARITLNRPDAANGMNDTMTRELADARQALRHRGNEGRGAHWSGPILLRGRRSQVVRRRRPAAAGFIKGVADELHRAISTFARMDAVLITAVNGIAAGAGFSLAVTGDLVLAAESASFTMAYTRAGLSPDGSSSYYLPRLIGIPKTQGTDADQPHPVRARTRRVGAGHRGRSRCRARRPRGSAGRPNGRHRKEIQRRGEDSAARHFQNGIEEQMELEGRLIAAAADSADGREGVDAFMAKRKPSSP